MTVPRFLQIHTLHSYPAALLNRDDSGLAKRLSFGGSVRTRVSSQCLKRHWRTADDEFALGAIEGAADAIRSRNAIGRMVMESIRADNGASEDVLKAVEEALYIGVYAGSNPTAQARQRALTEEGRQPLLLGLPEVEYLRKKAKSICDEHRSDKDAAQKASEDLFRTSGEGSNFRAFRQQASLPGGLIGALFGRMVTSDPGANIEAAVHVSHAFTVHAEESESDYFSVVDDLQEPDEDVGAAHIGDMELTAGLFYGYVVVDVPGLVSNLEGCDASDWQNGDRELAAKVVKHLVHLIATVSPGAKLGSTAPYAAADLMLIEAGNRQPRSLANAYREPTAARTDAAMDALESQLAALDDCYGVKEARRVMSVGRRELPGASWLSCDALATWAADAVRAGEAA